MKKRKDGRWEKVVRIDGKSHHFYSTAPTESKAEIDINHQMVTYKTYDHSQKHNFKILADRLIEIKENNTSHATVETYKHSIKHLKTFYDCNIEDITPVMVQNLLNRMALQNFSQSAISKTKIIFGQVLDFAIMQDLPINNFMRSIKMPKNIVKHKISAPDDEVISLITKNATDENFGFYAAMLLYTGMRRGELLAIQIKDIDFKNELIHIWRSVEFINNQPHLKTMPKTQSGVRDVPILSPIKTLLSEYCRGRKKDEFLFGCDKPLTATIVNKRWKKYCNEIGITIHQHQLRHAYAKILYRAGIDAKTAQGLLGHSDVQITLNIYTDFSEDVSRKSVTKINKFITKNYD